MASVGQHCWRLMA